MNRRSQLMMLSLIGAFLFGPSAGAQDGEVIPFDSERWVMGHAQILEHLGRQCLIGTATLEDVEFEDGTIEFDIATDGSRAYPGILFRMQSDKNLERFYVRPHRAGLYADALQYVPTIQGVSAWQFYYGEGYTASVNRLPTDRWIRVRMEIRGAQARVFLDDVEEPALVVPRLAHGRSRGAIGVLVLSSSPEAACLSHFRYRLDAPDLPPPPPEPEIPAGTLTEWEISQPFPAEQPPAGPLFANPTFEHYPHFYLIYHATSPIPGKPPSPHPYQWKRVTAEPSGWIDISRHTERIGQPARDTDVIFARTVFRSDRHQDVKLSFGYSDEVSLFFNGKLLFMGNSAYRSRDSSFVGVMGLYDTVVLPAEKGLNEIFLILRETFGGWGFIARADLKLAAPVKDHRRLSKVWETPAELAIPEQVLFDREREILYVTNSVLVGDNDCDLLRGNPHRNSGFISRVSLQGEIEELRWIDGLDFPCGMSLHENKLYVVEAFGHLVEIDVGSREIVARYPAPGFRFLNDVAVDRDGTAYVSNTTPQLDDIDIYRLRDGRLEIWKEGDEIHRANGLFVHDHRLLVGNSGAGNDFLKSIDLDTGRVETIASLGAGIVDGIRVDGEGHFLVSHWEGKIYHITPSGEVTEILDATGSGLNTAAFELIPERKLLVVPTFCGNKVVAYRLVDG